MVTKINITDTNVDDGTVTLTALFLTLLKVGCTSFGGFMALIAAVQNYVVHRRKLISHEEFLDAISLAAILPGPVAVNVVAFVGFRIRGGKGALVSVAGVILPSFLLIVGLSFLYFQVGHVPAVGRFLHGFIPAVAAIIFVAAWNMGSKAITGIREAALALGAAAILMGIGGLAATLVVIVLSGLIGALLFTNRSQARGQERISAERDKHCPGISRTSVNAVASPLLAIPVLSISVTPLLKLFVTFGLMSLLLFGGGYVFVPLMQNVVVDGNAWVTRQEFIDAIALGQVTPGPIVISAAFIGYKVGGVLGAVAATAGVFLPPALVMLVCVRGLDRIKKSSRIKAALHGIRPAVVGLIAVAGISVARSAPMNGITLMIFGASLIALFLIKVEAAWVVPVAGLAGLLLY